MEKLNIAELLKDCPRGMELDCTMFENVTFVRVDNNREQFPIEIAIGGLRSKYLTKEGCFHDTIILPEAKCVIFPKGKTTWEGFQRPFKDGDVVAPKDKNNSLISFIYKNRENDIFVNYHFALYIETLGCEINNYVKISDDEIRPATEREKARLFDAIKANGYKWNDQTKTLEKLIKPNNDTSRGHGKSRETDYISCTSIETPFVAEATMINQEEWESNDAV